MKKSIIALAFVLLASGCTVNHGTYTVISKNVVNLNDFDISKTDKIRNVKGSSVRHSILFFSFGEMNPNIESAIDDGFKKADGDLFTDAKVTETAFTVILYGMHSVNIQGDVVKTRK